MRVRGQSARRAGLLCTRPGLWFAGVRNRSRGRLGGSCFSVSMIQARNSKAGGEAGTGKEKRIGGNELSELGFII